MFSSSFLFVDDFDPELSQHVFLIQIPAGISSKDVLLAIYKENGHFPDYFGCNWDSLRDCLSDFSWVDSSVIIISHADLPLVDEKESRKIYMQILSDSVASFELTRDRMFEAGSSRVAEMRLLIRFPSAERAAAEEFLVIR